MNRSEYSFPNAAQGKAVIFAGQEALSSHFMKKRKEELEKEGREVVELFEPYSQLDLKEALGTSLFSSSKLVIIRNLHEVTFDYLKILKDFLKSDSDVILLITADSKFARSKACGELEQAGCKKVFYPEPDYLSSESMVRKLFLLEGGKIDPAASLFLAKSVEDGSLLVGFCLQLLSECQNVVSKEDVFAVTGLYPRITAFDVAKKALAGDRSSLCDLNRVLKEGEKPIAVIGALDYKFREQCMKNERILSPQSWASVFSSLSMAHLASTSSSPQKGIDLIYKALIAVCEGRRWKK